MRTVHLHGELATEFGGTWTLDVSSAAEAFRAIEANKPGFARRLLESGERGVSYRIVAGPADVKAADLAAPLGKRDLHLVPVMAGAKSGGLSIVLGAALIVGAMYGLPTEALFTVGSGAGAISVSVASIAFSIGTNLLLGGVSQMLSGTPDNSASAQVDQKPGYYFNGPINTLQEGSGVPVGYGELIIGSIPVSAGLSTENVI